MTSGIRIGTPAMTTRGMGLEESTQVANWISEAILHRDNDAKLAQIREGMHDLCARFPVYPSELMA